ncbi:MAG: dihydroorotate dehydrogenase electron transfer subunit [Victivallales bacterium]|nr:dihydroorotate dehydrogenase electron transfer subunit [Victivallales bacterium]
MSTQKFQVQATITRNARIQGDYFRLDFVMPDLPAVAQPGQFVHVQIPGLEGHILRRPFSIFDTDAATGRLSLIYKVVGLGTEQLSHVPEGAVLDVVGPLGRPFSPLPAASVIVAGGYGCAATFLLAKQATTPPTVLIGGRSQADILLVEEYRALGCEVLVSTDDGSAGFHGRVTALLEENHAKSPKAWLASCGPIPMLRTLAELMPRLGIAGELSLDQAMCCGVGACFACVTKVKDTSPQGWKYARICYDGPVFPAEQLVF